MGFSKQEYWSGLSFPSPGEASQPRDWTPVFCAAGGLLYCRQILYGLTELSRELSFGGKKLPQWVFIWKKQQLSLWENIYFPGGSYGKESACKSRFNPWVWKIPWRREWQPTLVFFPGGFHGQRSLAGYSPWGHKELDTIEWTNTLLPLQYLNKNHWFRKALDLQRFP